jgi:hypothetical protein
LSFFQQVDASCCLRFSLLCGLGLSAIIRTVIKVCFFASGSISSAEGRPALRCFATIGGAIARFSSALSR